MENKINITLLMEKFDIYYQKAKECQKNKQLKMAKQNYFKSAEILLQLAKASSPELAKARIARANKIVFIAENLKISDENSNKVNDEIKHWKNSEIPDIHFSDIVGLEDVKEAITIRMIFPIKYPDLYSAYKKQTGGGVLLYGPPGTGKTMVAKAIACEVGASFYAIKGSDIISKWVGESEKNINSLFESARKDKLAIIFIDEVDTLLGKRGVDTHNDKRVNEFLQQFDGFCGKSSNLLVLGATNRPWDIDSAAMRSGRFSEKIYVPLPDKNARQFLFEKYLKDLPVEEGIDYIKLAEITEGLSGADINQICDNAKIEPLKTVVSNREQGLDSSLINITMNDLYKGIEKIKYPVSKKDLEKFTKFAKEYGEEI